MSKRALSVGMRLRKFITSVATLSVCGLLAAATAAQAASFDGSGGFSPGSTGTAAHAVAAVVQPHVSAAPIVAPGFASAFASQPRPLDGSTGLFIGGNVSATWGSGVADMRASFIANERASGTSGDLTLHLVATSSPPPVGSFSGFELASVNLGTLPAGSEFANFDSGTVPFAPPGTPGCYYVSLVLEENGSVTDVRTFPAGGTYENTGYSIFPFGGATCPAATSCTRTSGGACLVGARFQVTATYDNTVTGAGVGQVLSFSGTRAESNESVFYYFTDSSNFELGVKVLNACSFSNHFWVFIGGLTNQGWNVNVLDTQTGHQKTYGNTLGVTTVTVTDTAALPCP
ncbi:MAG TPA: hypothetical protein VHG32_22715 [Thermoanaerobaculia bacterium]|jgi:hypothetical protein|nr:hypothetical protein [Thermoanaerobaculia bacterium]